MCSVSIFFPPEAGGEAGPADQEAREAGPGRRQPGPEWCQRVAEAPPNEGDNGASSALCLSAVSQPITSTHPSIRGRCILLSTPPINIIPVLYPDPPPVALSFTLMFCTGAFGFYVSFA